MFEIIDRDCAGRIGKLETPSGIVETPILLPVINPNKMTLGIDDIKNLGAQAIMTNAYIIYKSKRLRERALEEGLHSLLGFDGPIFTDSGAYQLMVYGDIDISPEEILIFQDRIGADVGTILDIPAPPDSPRDQAERSVRETIARARKAIEIERRMLLNLPIQGSTHLDLREECAEEMRKLDGDLYPIGGVVPLMENYRFSDLVRIIVHVKMRLGSSKPVHLFGCGHPMIFPLAVALGCDIFDSAAYSLYAEEGRYITPDGTLRLEDLRYLPCSCIACSGRSPDDLDERLLALHNLAVSLEEIRRVKQAIRQGRLWELVERRARAHPALLDAVSIAYDYFEYLEKLEPITKQSAVMYCGLETLERPSLIRFRQRILQRYYQRSNIALILDEVEKPYSRALEEIRGAVALIDIYVLNHILGPVPLELDDLYPVAQSEYPKRDPNLRRWALDYARVFVEKLGYEEVYSNLDGVGERIEDPLSFIRDNLSMEIPREERFLERKIESILNIQYGFGVGSEILRRGRLSFQISKKTGKIRSVMLDGEILGSIRASDSLFIPNRRGAELLHELLPEGSYRVSASEEATEFVSKGRNLFAKFVEDADREIRPRDEVLVVSDSKLVAVGRAELSGEEMIEFNRGIAVRVRRGFG